MFLNLLGNIFASREANFVPAQCLHGWANRETFEETSRITNVSATMFPSLPRALGCSISFVVPLIVSSITHLQ
jgi:hypothetical protein